MSDPAPVVLVVDPDAGVHEAVAKALGGECALLGARSGPLAVKLAQKRRPALAMIDFATDDLEGLVASLRICSSEVRFVFTHGGELPERVLRILLELGAVVKKPFESAGLQELVRDLSLSTAGGDNAQRTRTETHDPRNQ